MVRNSDFVDLIMKLMDLLGLIQFYEGITVPEEFAEMNPVWRGFYIFRAGGDEEKAEELFANEADDKAEEEFEKLMNSELNYKFVQAVLRELLKDVTLYLSSDVIDSLREVGVSKVEVWLDEFGRVVDVATDKPAPDDIRSKLIEMFNTSQRIDEILRRYGISVEYNM